MRCPLPRLSCNHFHSLSGRKPLRAANHQLITRRDGPPHFDNIGQSDTRGHIQFLDSVGMTHAQHVGMTLSYDQRVAWDGERSALSCGWQADLDRGSDEPVRICKNNAHFELAGTIIAHRDDRSDAAGALQTVIPDAHNLTESDVRSEPQCSRCASFDVGGVYEANRGGSQLHVLAFLNETLCHDAGKRCTDLRLVDLVRRLA